jgi:hypothetical protein
MFKGKMNRETAETPMLAYISWGKPWFPDIFSLQPVISRE